MSRKDFELIARVIKNIEDENIRKETALNFANELQSVNPRFDVSRFVKACTGMHHKTAEAAALEIKWADSLRAIGQ